MRRVLAGLCGAGLAVALVFSFVGSGGAASSKTANRPPNCRASFDVYDYSAAVLRACGYRVYPLTRVKPLPGGGEAAIYDEGRQTLTVLTPPKRFNPLTATKAQLSEFGLPTRPTKPAQLAVWRTEMGHWRGAAPIEPFDVGDPFAHFGGLQVRLP